MPAPTASPVDLVPHDVPADQPKPFSLRLEDAAKTARLNTALFIARTAPTTATLESGRAHRARSRSTSSTEDAAGLRARKQFRFEPQSYVVTCQRERDATAIAR